MGQHKYEVDFSIINVGASEFKLSAVITLEEEQIMKLIGDSSYETEDLAAEEMKAFSEKIMSTISKMYEE